MFHYNLNLCFFLFLIIYMYLNVLYKKLLHADTSRSSCSNGRISGFFCGQKILLEHQDVVTGKNRIREKF